jgi:hypothetical protein
MSCFLNVDDAESKHKINIDDLYEKKKQRDLKQLTIFNKILNRIHRRITHASRNKPDDLHIWFTVPEYIFGEPVYDKGDCTGFLVMKLEENGFLVRYIHPNTLFISWKNWVPTYVRNEIKKKTGVVLDEKGNVIDKSEKLADDENDINSGLFNGGGGGANNAPQKAGAKQYTPIDNYKPTGNLVYNPEIFEKLGKRIEKQK